MEWGCEWKSIMLARSIRKAYLVFKKNEDDYSHIGKYFNDRIIRSFHR